MRPDALTRHGWEPRIANVDYDTVFKPGDTLRKNEKGVVRELVDVVKPEAAYWDT